MAREKKLLDQLMLNYGKRLNAAEICRDENITIVRSEFLLDDDVDGYYMRFGRRKAITVSTVVPDYTQNLVLWHELHHHFVSEGKITDDLFNEGEVMADRFAVVALCPHVRPNDTIDSVASFYRVSVAIAFARLNLKSLTKPFLRSLVRRDTIGGNINNLIYCGSSKILPV